MVWAEEVVQSVNFHLRNPCKQDPSPGGVETGGSLGTTVMRRENMQKKGPRNHERAKKARDWGGGSVVKST